MQANITVICVRFGTKYGIDYVERLRNMVSRHLTIPYEFVCLTDSTEEIANVRTIYQPNAGYNREWWHKIHLFDPNLPVSSSILYFDLDVVIHSNINKLVAANTHDFFGIRDFNRQFNADWGSLNSSVMAWTHGEQSHVWHEFKKDYALAMRLHGDQDWIWKTSRKRISFWPDTWIRSYKWEIRSKQELDVINGKRQFVTQNDNVVIPPDCCVAVFHGDPKPQDIPDKFVTDNWK